DVHGREVTSGAAFPPEPLHQYGPHRFRLLPQPVGVVLGGTGDRSLGVEPVPRLIHVQVGGALAEHLQRGTEVAHGVPGHRHPEPDMLPLDAFVSGLESGGGADEDGAGDPPGERPGPEGLAFAVDPYWGGVLPVDVRVDDRLPGVWKVLGELTVDR